MTTLTTARRGIAAAALVGAALGLAGCGGDAPGGQVDAGAADITTTDEVTEPVAEAAEQPEASAQQPETPAETDAEGDAGSAAGGGDPTATLTLANGETLTFAPMCALEPQEAAGSVIEFTAVSYGDPGLDVTQFGDDGTVTDTAVITVSEAETYDTLWEAGSQYESMGGTITLALTGSTITGSGSFFPGGDVSADPVAGELVVNC